MATAAATSFKKLFPDPAAGALKTCIGATGNAPRTTGVMIPDSATECATSSTSGRSVPRLVRWDRFWVVDGQFNGRIIGCDAVVAVGEEQLQITLSLPWEMVDQVKMGVRQIVVIRSGDNRIWFETADPDGAFAAISGQLSFASDTMSMNCRYSEMIRLRFC